MKTSPSTARSVARPASTRVSAALTEFLTLPPLKKGTLRSAPAERVGPLPPVLRMPLRLRSRLRPTVALTCGRPAALAIATMASVARSASRWAVNVGLVW